MTPEIFRLFLVIFNFILGILSAVIVFYLYNLKNNFEVQVQKTDNLKDQIHALETKLPEKYVMREDYIRTMASFQHKLDKTYDLMKGSAE